VTPPSVHEPDHDASTSAADDAAMRLAQSIVESAPDAMVIVGERGSIVLVNSQTEKLFGYARAELLGQPVEKLMPQRLRERHREHHRPGYFAAPGFRPMGAGLELSGVRKDGTEFPIEISLSPIATDGGTLVSSTIRDVTERKRYEQALQQKNLELENALLTKDRFLASMSHELRTPLNAIIGFTGTLLMRLPGPLLPDQEHQLKTVQASGRGLLSLINNLLDLAKVDSGRVELRFGPVDCRAVLDQMAAAKRPLADAKELSLVVECEPGLPVETDPEAFDQIVSNLVDNAIKFTTEGGVRVAAQPVSDGSLAGVEISVTDTGGGIAPDEQPQLFQLAEIAKLAGRPTKAGGGLGLHLSQKLARLLGGRITMESGLGRGSSFRLWLPAVRP